MLQTEWMKRKLIVLYHICPVINLKYGATGVTVCLLYYLSSFRFKRKLVFPLPCGLIIHGMNKVLKSCKTLFVWPDGGTRGKTEVVSKNIWIHPLGSKNIHSSIYGNLGITVSLKCQWRGNLDIMVVYSITKMINIHHTLYNNLLGSCWDINITILCPSPCSTKIHICFCQRACSCILLPACIYVYFMSTVHAAVCIYSMFECLQILRGNLSVSHRLHHRHWKQQQCIPWSVWLGWELLHPNPLWLVWHLKWTLTGCLDIKLLPHPQWMCHCGAMASRDTFCTFCFPKMDR